MAPGQLELNKKQVRDAAKKCESQRQLALTLGVSQGGLQGWLGRKGMAEEISGILARNRTATREKAHQARAEAQQQKADDQPVDDPQRIRIDQLTAENKALSSEHKELRAKLASQEEYFERIVEAVRVPVEVPKFKKRRQGKTQPEESTILPIYDQQFGQFVRAVDTPGGRGGFDVEVFDRRLERYVDGAKGILAARGLAYRLDELFFILGGDQVEGDEIFPGQAWQLALDPPRQVWELACRMREALIELIVFAKEELGIPKIALYGVPGNHGKVGGRKSGSRPATYNWDWLLYKILFDQLRDAPIDQVAIEPGGAILFKCAGHEFQAIHGDEVKAWGGIPFYGLTRFHGKAQAYHQRLYRYCLMGHHHQPASIPNGTTETIISPDWVGPNNLTKQMVTSSRPGQNILFVSRKWGLDAPERIYFMEAEEAYAPTEVHDLSAA